MDLNIVWFVLIAVLYTGFFVLEGFDFGVGILLPFLGKDDKTRRMMINTIGPHWDGNEVWLLTAGGATFAAFPNWYATMFSGFYLALFLLLLALIVRGVAFEFRSKDHEPALARAVGLVHLHRQPGAGAAAGRGLRQHAARHAHRRGNDLYRRLLQPAQPLCAGGRPDGRGHCACCTGRSSWNERPTASCARPPQDGRARLAHHAPPGRRRRHRHLLLHRHRRPAGRQPRHGAADRAWARC